jgi:hypothetical protein
LSTRSLTSCGGHESGEFLGWRPALEGQREAIVVVVGFPGAQAHRGRIEILELLPAPELLLIDAVAAFDLAVLLGAPRLDVPVPDAQGLDRQGEREREFVAVVPAESW